MICRFNSSSINDTVFIKAITEKEEKAIDRNNYPIDTRNIFFYGEIDVTKDEDIRHITEANLVDRDGRGMIYSRFNYEKGTFDLIDEQVKWAPTSNPLEWFKFKHCLIGKPKRVIVYKGY